MTTKTSSNPWTLDVRTRERNLKAGTLTEKDLEKHLAQLPDLDGQFDSFSTPQPALAQPAVVAPVVDDSDDSDEDLGDQGEDEGDDDDDAGDDESSDDVAGGGDDAGGGGDEPSEGGQS